jgi:UDP-N-acetylglucosamine 4,6-dehydratase/5-epimerase
MEALRGKRVLVTGGTGAFGRRFTRAFREAGGRGLVLLSRDEMKHAALKRELGPEATNVELRIGDIAEPEDLQLALRGVDVVIHAAAMKHLPECEANVRASTRVNVLGTQLVADAFLRSTAEALVFLSTDKAPYASSVYGAQKYIGEKIVTECARIAEQGRRAFSLRYSNVMDSTGSVFHIFRDRLTAGKPAMVNGAQTERGFVTQSEVIGVLGAALAHARGGEVVVLVPKVVRIHELANALCKLIGKGEVQLAEGTAFLGEKESATLVMAEEARVARQLEGVSARAAVLLDLLGRSAHRPASEIAARGLTLEACERLSGAELERYLAPLV